jgi:hypothetical protein
MTAGARDEAGRFPEGTVNGRAEGRLVTFAKQARAFRAIAEEPRK